MFRKISFTEEDYGKTLAMKIRLHRRMLLQTTGIFRKCRNATNEKSHPGQVGVAEANYIEMSGSY